MTSRPPYEQLAALQAFIELALTDGRVGGGLPADALELVFEIRRDDVIAKVLAERDGWRDIAIQLLKAAFGDEVIANKFPVPPIELANLRRVPPEYLARLEQWWADVTRKHDQRRRKHRPDPCKGSGRAPHVVGNDHRLDAFQCGFCVARFTREQILPTGTAPSHNEAFLDDEDR